MLSLKQMPIATVFDEQPNALVKPLIESSTYRSYKAYVDAGFESHIPRRIRAQWEERESRFLSAVDTSKGAPKRQITKMVRRKHEGKEYLTFMENWYARDWKNAKVNPVIERIEGILDYPETSPAIDEQGQKIGTDYNNNGIKYEIPFSEENVNKWLEETGTPKEEVQYVVKGPNTRRDKCVVYEQFVYPWNQAVDALMKDGGFETDYVEKLKSTSQQSKSKS